jgi:hypothetical protein
MLQAWMSYGYIVLLAIGVLAYVLWRRGGAVLAIASILVGIPLWFAWEYARPTWTTGLVTGTEVRRSNPDARGKLIGAKPPLRPSHAWSIRAKLQMQGKTRDLALFNLAIDSKLRGCDLVAVRVDDVAPSGYAMDRATIRQTKTGRAVELTDQTRQAIDRRDSSCSPAGAMPTGD